MRYEAFVILPDEKVACNSQPRRKFVVAASFQFGDAGKFVPQWLALAWCSNRAEAEQELSKQKRSRSKARRSFPIIETAIIPVLHRKYHR